jgi:hypothetical protein
MLLVFLVLVALLAVSIFLFVTDYLTSVYGYYRLGTERVSDAEAWFVGALPQLVQVAFGFMALERRSWLFGGLAGGAFLIDVGTDVAFRVGDEMGFAIFAIAILQSIILFTLGSEFLLVASLENIIEYLPDVLEAMAISSSRLVASFTRVADTFQGMKTTSRWPGEKADAAGVTARSAPANSQGGGRQTPSLCISPPARLATNAWMALQWVIYWARHASPARNGKNCTTDV